MGDDNWRHLPQFISTETVDAICSSLREVVDSTGCFFSVVLHGGEPLLLGPKRLQALFEKLREALPANYPISIQTNGVLISKEILDICSYYSVSVAVSIDGPEIIHNKHRIDHKRSGTFNSVMNGIELLKSHENSGFLNSGVLAVIDPSSDPQEVYSFFKRLGVPSVDLLYKDGNHDALPVGKSAITSTEYGAWMCKLLDIYASDPEPLPIRVIDDMLKVLLGGTVSKEGLGETDFGIIIIDTDGTLMKNDTLKSVYNGADKFSKSYNIKSISLLQFLQSSEYSLYRAMQKPTSPACLACPDLSVCGGGMILHRWKKDSGFSNVSVYCSDQKLLISKMRNLIFQYSRHHATRELH